MNAVATPTAPAQSYRVIVGWKPSEGGIATVAPGGLSSSPETQLHSGIRVLIVDDELVIREALKDLLGDCGFEVVGVAADGDEGAALAENLLPDVVVMDIRMRETDGIEATRRIRRAVPNVNVIIVSAYDDRTLRRSAHAAGAHSYLLKGASVEHIERAIVEAARAPKRLQG